MQTIYSQKTQTGNAFSQVGITIGSSGLGDKRFLEIVQLGAHTSQFSSEYELICFMVE
jgi:hypothetical protein